MTNGVYKVSEVLDYLEDMTKSDPFLTNLSVEGEVSGVNYNSRGHIYFNLKDEIATMSVAMWKSFRETGIDFTLKDGDKVVIRGYFNLWKERGTISIVARSIKKQGQGELYQKFLMLKTELEDMGMFDAMYKKPIPKYATRIGVVTAPTGAVIHDIIRNARIQNPGVEIILCPAIVQGAGAAKSIAKAIRQIDALGLDLLIVGRGGGDIEDLWCFNEWEVANAIFQAKTPIISAVGHETDTTIADFVADLRVATPTEAAKKACFSMADTKDELYRREEEFDYRMNDILHRKRMQLEKYGETMKSFSPEEKLKALRERMTYLESTMHQRMQYAIEGARQKISSLAGLLDAASPAKRLSGGYSFVTTSKGTRLTEASQVNVGDEISLFLQKGVLKASVTEKVKED